MIKLKVNGEARQSDGDPEMPLLWYLRDEINFEPLIRIRRLLV